MTLEQAIKEISAKHFSHQLPIQMVEFEDGSGYKFNYRLKGEQKNRYISLCPTNSNKFVEQFAAAKKIMDKW